ncbi:hypothetical protein K474DRAFT_1279125 [Panus rudis PR-1116 ss-1]|nr:hypothetical protein K474DRAFT_1279125 [Panus rudis PR-1116 ss-1]
MTTTFRAVPVEIAEEILAYCHPRDVARVSQTCRQFHSIVYEGDRYLWRALFLSYPFDDPRQFSSSPSNASKVDQADDYDWMGEVQRRVYAEIVVLSGRKGRDLTPILRTLLSGAALQSYNITWLEKILKDTDILRDESTNSEELSLRHQLRSYISLSYDTKRSPFLKQLRLQSRCCVYDLRNYNAANLWGPYTIVEGEIRPNWKHVESIINVVTLNMRELDDIPAGFMLFRGKFRKPSLERTRAYSAPGTRNRKPHDWAGVEGTWRRIVAFMDYRELFAFNYSDGNGTANPDFFDDEVEEAVRLVEMNLTIDRDAKIEPEQFDDPAYPPIAYRGIARGTHSAVGQIKGTVRRYRNGTIRWTFLTYYDGDPQWSAEGVQLGNVCSASGMAGVWTGADHAVGDPAGPFLMWKVQDAPLASQSVKE